MVINETKGASQTAYANNVIGVEGIELREVIGTDGTVERGRLVKNIHGDTIAVVGGNEYLAQYEYDAFGKCETESESGFENPIRYSGEYWDEESDMLYLRARYYDSDLRRFISEDPARDGMNWYAYCYNNPLMFVDPWGLIPSLEDAAEMAVRSYVNYTGFEDIDSRRVGDGWRLIDVWEGSEGLVIHIYVRGDGEHSSYTGPKEYAFVNKGSSTWGDWVNNFQQPFGWSTDMWESIAKAEYFAEGDWGNYEITFIGHSKGGAEAAANAVATNRNAILFNPAAAALSSYGLDSSSYSASMTAYVVWGEPLSMVNWLLGANVIDGYETLPFYSWNPIKNHSMEAIVNGLKGR